MGVRLSLVARAALFAPYLLVFYPLLAARRAFASVRPQHGWRTWVTPHLLLGGFVLPGDVADFQRLGIRAVLNVTRELYDPVAALRAAGIDYLRVPSWDMSAPTLEDTARGVRFLADHIAAGRRAYVHCASGVGRSVVMTLCYLATHEGYDVDDALVLLKRLRPRVALRPVQRAFVDRYVAWHRAQQASAGATAGAAESAR